ncbi:unnamed protein product [Owenia fusiformis]|uniref:B30.2/SPRY domain-containing protein n=1 Tax=Owenia fusiformis TaxID=6347 RepID=A0A8S4P5U4_OWEFU|nr:unnamed protein product [Owenia fusiformis]
MEPSSILILVIGIVVVAALLLFAICYCRMNQRKLQRYMSPAKKEVTNEDDDHGTVELAITKAFTDEEFCWSRQGSSEGFTIEDANTIVLITHQFTGTHAARSNLGFLRGRHVWEITWPRDCRDNHSSIGVGTYQAPLYNRGLLDLVGFNIQSWGWNIKNLNLIHNNRTIKKYPDLQGQEPNIPDQLIVSLDMEKGTLSFGSYQSSYGVAFKGLGGGRLPLFPMISTTSLDVRVAIRYIGSACLSHQATVPSNHNEMTSGNITAYTTHKAVNRTPNAKFEPSITPGSIMKSIRRSFKRKKKYPQSPANTPVSTIGDVSSYQMRRDPRRHLYQRDTTTTLNLNPPRYNQYSPKQYPETVSVAEIHAQNQRDHRTSNPQRGQENAVFYNEHNHNRDVPTPRSADRAQGISPRYDAPRYPESIDTFDKQTIKYNAGGRTHHMIHEGDSAFDEQRNPSRPTSRAKHERQSPDYRDHHTIEQQSHKSGLSGHNNNTGPGDPIRPSRRNDTLTRYSNDTSRSESANSYTNSSYKTNYSSRQYGNHGQREVNSSSPSYTQSDYSESKGALRPVVNRSNQYEPSLDNSYRSQPVLVLSKPLR